VGTEWPFVTYKLLFIKISLYPKNISIIIENNNSIIAFVRNGLNIFLKEIFI